MPPRKPGDPADAERRARLLAEINADADAAMARAAADATAPGRALVPSPAPAAPSSDPLGAELASLGETLDMVATLVASASDRVDGQTAALTKLTGTVAEARQAAFAARAQSDPGKLATAMSEAFTVALLPRLRELAGAVERLGRMDEERTTYGRLQGQVADLGRDLRRERERAALWRARLPGIGAAALVLILALLALAPRLMADYPITCLFMGGDWGDYRDWDNGTACRFERP